MRYTVAYDIVTEQWRIQRGDLEIARSEWGTVVYASGPLEALQFALAVYAEGGR